MKLFLRIIVVVSVLQSAVWSATLPAELLNWQMPQQVKLQGTFKITNGITSASGTYNIESWHFKGSQIHILDSQKDSLRLVLYWIEGSSSFSYWSKGYDVAFGGTMADNVEDRNYAIASTMSALSRLNGFINRMKTAKDSDITLSTNSGEGTVTVKKTVPGQYYSQHFKDIFHYRDNRLLSVDRFLSGEDHQTGEKTAPVLTARTVFSDYSSNPSPIPMSCSFASWLPMAFKEVMDLFDWHYHSVTPIADGETAKTVLSGATSGLTLDRWPARLPKEYPMNVQKKPLVTTFLVSLGIGLFAVLFLAWLWKRRRS